MSTDLPKISDAVIRKLQLQPCTHTIGKSFMTNSRIFLWPELSNSFATLYLMECDLLGERFTDRKATILARGRTHYKFGVISYDMLEQFVPGKLARIVQQLLLKEISRPHGYAKMINGTKPIQLPNQKKP